MSTVIYKYTLDQAIADGVLVKLFENRWPVLSGGKPIVATAHLFDEVTMAGLLEIWNSYVEWRIKVNHLHSEKNQNFRTKMNEKTVWVIEDGQAFTLLYPED